MAHGEFELESLRAESAVPDVARVFQSSVPELLVDRWRAERLFFFVFSIIKIRQSCEAHL